MTIKNKNKNNRLPRQAEMCRPVFSDVFTYEIIFNYQPERIKNKN